jgi:hypothetical protein
MDRRARLSAFDCNRDTRSKRQELRTRSEEHANSLPAFTAGSHHLQNPCPRAHASWPPSLMAAGADALLPQLRALVASLATAPNAPVTQQSVERVRAAAAALCAWSSEQHDPDDAAGVARGVWEVALELWCVVRLHSCAHAPSLAPAARMCAKRPLHSRPACCCAQINHRAAARCFASLRHRFELTRARRCRGKWRRNFCVALSNGRGEHDEANVVQLRQVAWCVTECAMRVRHACVHAQRRAASAALWAVPGWPRLQCGACWRHAWARLARHRRRQRRTQTKV